MVTFRIFQDGRHPSTGILETLDTDTSIAEIWTSCHHEQIHRCSFCSELLYKVLSDIENLVRCTPAKVGKGSKRTSIVNSVEKNRAHICEGLDGKPLLSGL
jgi:hypothetical protein